MSIVQNTDPKWRQTWTLLVNSNEAVNIFLRWRRPFARTDAARTFPTASAHYRRRTCTLAVRGQHYRWNVLRDAGIICNMKQTSSATQLKSLSIQALMNNTTMHFNIVFIITCQGTKSIGTGDGAFSTHGTKRCIRGSDQKHIGVYRRLTFRQMHAFNAVY